MKTLCDKKYLNCIFNSYFIISVCVCIYNNSVHVTEHFYEKSTDLAAFPIKTLPLLEIYEYSDIPLLKWHLAYLPN